MAAKVASCDHRVAEVAARQHGVLSVDQLRAAGMSRNAVRGRVEAGRMHRIHRGVYAIGHSGLSMHGRWMAAVLACGVQAIGGEAIARATEDGMRCVPDATVSTATIIGHWGAALSHRAAAGLWGLLAASEGPVDISVPGDGGRAKRRGIRLHRRLSLPPASVTLHRGIPITTPARTVADLRRAIVMRGPAGGVSAKELRRAIRQANVLGLPIGSETGRDRTRSDLELDFLRLCRRYRLPEPKVNVRVGQHLVDFLWPSASLVVETDGYLYHRGRMAFQDDHRRDLALGALGYEVIRLSEEQVEEEGARIAEHLRGRLRGPAAPRADL